MSRSSLFDSDYPFSPRNLRLHYGWVVAAASLLGFLASVPGHSMGVNVFAEQLIIALELSRVEISVAFFAGTGLSAFFFPTLGRIYDHWGARRLSVFSGLALAITLCYLSGVDRIAAFFAALCADWVPVSWARLLALTAGFLALRFCGDGVLALCARNMISKWWKRRRGRVLSVVGIFASIMYSLSPQVFDFGIETFGWRTTWRLMALFLASVFCLLSWLLYRDEPESCGLEPDAGMPQEPEGNEHPEFAIIRVFTRPEAMRRFVFWCFAAIFFAHSCFYTGYVFHVVDVAAALGIEKHELLRLFFPAAILMGITNLGVGWACDRIRLKWVLLFMACASALGAASLGFGSGIVLKVGLTLGFGLSGGCFITLLSVFVPRFFGLRHVGSISGTVTALVLIGGSTGPLFFSLCERLMGGYREVSLLGVVVFGVIAAGSLWANNPQLDESR